MAEVCGHLRVRADAAPLRGRKLRCRFADAEATAGAGADASVFVEVRRSSVAGAELMLGDAAADAPARVLDVTPLLRGATAVLETDVDGARVWIERAAAREGPRPRRGLSDDREGKEETPRPRRPPSTGGDPSGTARAGRGDVAAARPRGPARITARGGRTSRPRRLLFSLSVVRKATSWPRPFPRGRPLDPDARAVDVRFQDRGRAAQQRRDVEDARGRVRGRVAEHELGARDAAPPDFYKNRRVGARAGGRFGVGEAAAELAAAEGRGVGSDSQVAADLRHPCVIRAHSTCAHVFAVVGSPRSCRITAQLSDHSLPS
mmetsp:Transcript_32520/g.97813  ORF Transcript_32520/g.97813 Transcript_32520/m.97813 type:complete len:319 (+) Transcript_32520:203-1159(+)